MVIGFINIRGDENILKRQTIILQIACLAILGCIAFSGISIAVPPAPTVPPLPTTPPTGGGGGGGGSGGYYSPPAFEPYNLPVKTSSGEVIGSVEGKSDFDITLKAEKYSLIDDSNYSLSYTGKLNYRPNTFWMDLNLEPASNNRLPVGMNDVQPLVIMNITSSGLDIKGGSVDIILKMPKSALGEVGANSVFYIVRYDGGYQIQTITPADSDNSSVSFNIKPQSNMGFYTLVKAIPTIASTPTPAPTATPIPCPTPSPTPEPSSNMNIYLTLIGVVVGAIVGAALVFFIKK